VTFLEYLWGLCFRPFTLIWNLANNSVYLFWLTISQLCERVRADIYWVRHQAYIRLASYWALRRHGLDIGFTKLESEDWETYRTRLLNAYEIYRMGGTIPGMILAMETLGLTDVEVVEHYQAVGQSEWAVFSVVTPVEEMPPGITIYDVDRLIKKLKPAHTLGVFRRECFLCDHPNSLTDRDWLCM